MSFIIINLKFKKVGGTLKNMLVCLDALLKETYKTLLDIKRTIFTFFTVYGSLLVF